MTHAIVTTSTKGLLTISRWWPSDWSQHSPELFSCYVVSMSIIAWLGSSHRFFNVTLSTLIQCDVLVDNDPMWWQQLLILKDTRSRGHGICRRTYALLHISWLFTFCCRPEAVKLTKLGINCFVMELLVYPNAVPITLWQQPTTRAAYVIIHDQRDRVSLSMQCNSVIIIIIIQHDNHLVLKAETQRSGC